MTNQRIKQQHTCQQCKTMFFPFRASKGLFCSNKCKFKASKLNRSFTCGYCNKTFPSKKPSPKFCSHNCYLLNKTTRSAEDRLNEQILKTDYCWLWQGGTNKAGYGRIFFNGKFWLAHRLMFQNVTGKNIAGKVVRHYECDNPPCVNPKHLKLGTKADNAQDAVKKGRHAHGETSYAKLTEADVLKIRKDKRKHKDIAKDYDVSRKCISHVQNRTTWKHLP